MILNCYCQVTLYDDNFPPHVGSCPMFLFQAWDWHWEWAASPGTFLTSAEIWAQCFVTKCCDQRSEAGSEHQHQDRDNELWPEEVWATGQYHHYDCHHYHHYYDTQVSLSSGDSGSHVMQWNPVLGIFRYVTITMVNEGQFDGGDFVQGQ